jgi:hypothetical protein
MPYEEEEDACILTFENLILIGFSVDSFLPVLVAILNMEHRPEMMLFSCRAITHLLEVMPKAAPKVAASGAVPIFCQRLLTIEFIDVAEQSLLAMHKLSIEHPEPLLRASGVSAVLTFIDFFDINTQRTAIATAANMCRNMPPVHTHTHTHTHLQMYVQRERYVHRYISIEVYVYIYKYTILIYI